MRRYGKTTQNKPRFCCSKCHKTFIYKLSKIKAYNEQHWFELWIKESYSIRQLSQISGHSKNKLERIKNHWLYQEPPQQTDYSKYKHLLFDGTYFHSQGCLIVLMDTLTSQVIDYDYVSKESYLNVHPWLLKLQRQGLKPQAVTMDGHRFVMRAFKDVWPEIKIQRCLYHILRQGISWLRMRPRTKAAKTLQALLLGICDIHSFKDRDCFLTHYDRWCHQYREFVKSLPKTSISFKDLKRTVGLIDNATSDLFHYLEDSNIRSTTNKLESFFSRLKADFQRHRGLSEAHKTAYLKWYCYYQNN